MKPEKASPSGHLLQTRVPRTVARQVRERAVSEGVTVAAWVRMAVLAEIGRPSLAERVAKLESRVSERGGAGE